MRLANFNDICELDFKCRELRSLLGIGFLRDLQLKRLTVLTLVTELVIIW